MAAARSPNYPSIDLGAAIEAVRPAYKAEHRNKMSREVLARHLGYSSLNGRALAKLGAVRAYGLIEGAQDELRISDDAITCLEAPEGAPERAGALERCALKPSIFRDIRSEYATLPSEHNLRFFLIKQNYTPDAASKAAQNYLATMRLVGESAAAYNPPADEEEDEVDADTGTENERRSPPPAKEAPLPAGTRKAVFTLEEGDVTLIFPTDLSADGYAELGDYLQIFLRRAQRQKAGTPEQ